MGMRLFVEPIECWSSYHFSGSDLQSNSVIKLVANAYYITGAIDIALGQGAAGVFTNSPTLWHCIFQVGTTVLCTDLTNFRSISVGEVKGLASSQSLMIDSRLFVQLEGDVSLLIPGSCF